MVRLADRLEGRATGGQSVTPALPALRPHGAQSVTRRFCADCVTQVTDCVNPRNAGCEHERASVAAAAACSFVRSCALSLLFSLLRAGLGSVSHLRQALISPVGAASCGRHTLSGCPRLPLPLIWQRSRCGTFTSGCSYCASAAGVVAWSLRATLASCHVRSTLPLALVLLLCLRLALMLYYYV